MSRMPVFFTYILTNWNRSVLYTGMTNDLESRLVEHWIGKEGSFTSRYSVFYLVWFESTRYVTNAIEIEKTIKRYSRQQKKALIEEFNRDWKFLNEEVLGNWPPTAEQVAAAMERKMRL
jgi:putative endonuclease